MPLIAYLFRSNPGRSIVNLAGGRKSNIPINVVVNELEHTARAHMHLAILVVILVSTTTKCGILSTKQA